jgi:flagellar hook protein FlgE
MSFYTALTGLNGSSADISATSNNIANVGTTGFKRSRVEFGDIFATSPLQNASSSIGSGTILKGIKQQFTQGNIAASLNALDLAISGQGFFALKPSLTSAQTVYTRNGSLNVNNDRYVVDSAGQYLLTYPVNTDGSVTAKDLDSAVPLQLPVTSGDPRATSDITLGVNVNAASDVVTDRPQFQDGYTFDPNDPETFSNSTSITIFDDLGNPTIATVYFIKTQAASADDPTNKYDTRLVINDTIIDPDLVSAVDDAGNQIFVDRFGQQTTTIPDDNYFIEGKGSPLYKLDDLQTLVPSQPAKISGESSSFDFGEEGDKLVEIVTDPLQFKSTRDAGNAGSDSYWGKDFLLVNVDDSDQPVSIDINPGFYNAEQLSEEVERAINAAYGDDRKFQVEQNVDDTISIDFQRVGADGTVTQLPSPISVNLLGTAGTSYVSDLIGQENPKFSITSTSPDFTKEELLAHSQARINETLNAYARSTTDSLGVSALKFAKSTGEKIASVYEYTQIVEMQRVDDATDKEFMVHSYFNKRPSLSVFTELEPVVAGPADGAGDTNLLEYDATNNRIRLFVNDVTNFEAQRSVMLAGDHKFGTARSDLNGREFTINSVTTYTATDTGYDANYANKGYIDIGTSGLAVSDSDFKVKSADATVFALTSAAANEPSMDAFFEGAHAVYEGAQEQYSSGKIIVREKQGSTADISKGAFVAVDKKIDNATGNANLATDALSLLGLQNLHHPVVLKEPASITAGKTWQLTLTTGGVDTVIETAANVGGANGTGTAGDVFTALNAKASDFTAAGYSITYDAASNPKTFTINRDDMKDFSIKKSSANANPTTQALDASITGKGGTFAGLTTTAVTSTILANSSVDWVDEKNPPVKVGYDEVNQRLKFEVDRTVLGSGTESNFNSFSVYGSSSQTGTNNLGLTNADNASQVQIRGGEVLYGDSFVATGAEIQPNDKRYGIDVTYNSDLQNFTISSGTTGEAIAADGANNVETDQKRSNIQIGRHTISTLTGARIEAAYDVDATILGGGDNSLFGLGATKDDFLFTAGTGLSAQPARAIGASANEPLDTVFKLSSQNGDNVFNVSVNGISGIIKVPATSYVGTTLAEALQTRINQITDPTTGDTIGGVTVSYSGDSNSFTFSTGTTGSDSTIKVKGAARLGLDDVPLGVGSVPEIYNLVQATDADGVALYVDANGEVVTNPPENMVEGYYPLYIDEGELTFDKTGKLVSPKNLVHYEKQEEGLSISLDIDFSTSTQLAQPFSVLTVDQDGFTSGRLDGIEIDSSGTIRANYTNGQNNPLGKIVVANFNNQNGLKQIGNATYTETAVSGAPQVGEAGAEGFGTVLSGSLERSNVDITEELVNLITAQRNFQASAKAIETTTGLTQTIINIRM